MTNKIESKSPSLSLFLGSLTSNIANKTLKCLHIPADDTKQKSDQFTFQNINTWLH